MKPSEYLQSMLIILERDGWCQGAAIRFASDGRPNRSLISLSYAANCIWTFEWKAVRAAICKAASVLYTEDLIAWNDSKSRTYEEVKSVLESALEATKEAERG